MADAPNIFLNRMSLHTVKQLDEHARRHFENTKNRYVECLEDAVQKASKAVDDITTLCAEISKLEIRRASLTSGLSKPWYQEDGITHEKSINELKELHAKFYETLNVLKTKAAAVGASELLDKNAGPIVYEMKRFVDGLIKGVAAAREFIPVVKSYAIVSNLMIPPVVFTLDGPTMHVHDGETECESGGVAASKNAASGPSTTNKRASSTQNPSASEAVDQDPLVAQFKSVSKKVADIGQIHGVKVNEKGWKIDGPTRNVVFATARAYSIADSEADPLNVPTNLGEITNARIAMAVVSLQCISAALFHSKKEDAIKVLGVLYEFAQKESLKEEDVATAYSIACVEMAERVCTVTNPRMTPEQYQEAIELWNEVRTKVGMTPMKLSVPGYAQLRSVIVPYSKRHCASLRPSK